MLRKTLKGIFYCFTDFNSDNWIYKIISLIGLVLRIWLLPIVIPNVFELLAAIFVSRLNLPIWLYEIVIRLILLVIDGLALSNIFYWITYGSVGNCYEGGSCPAWGSACYTIYYFMYMAIPVVIIQVFTWWGIVLSFVSYAVICFVLYFVSSKLEVLPEDWILRLILHVIFYAIIFSITCILKKFLF
ncbi:MAG: hypothetical protein IJZ73_00435 [Clostridia bacterium]|nr:hypothetical protein [Clostridia bacterium]